MLQSLTHDQRHRVSIFDVSIINSGVQLLSINNYVFHTWLVEDNG